MASTLASKILSEWPELLRFVSTCVENESVSVRENGIYLLSELLEDPGVFEFLSPHLSRILNVLVSAINQESRDTRRYALKGISHISINSYDTQTLNRVAEVIPQILTAIKDCVDSEDERTAILAFKNIENLLENSNTMTNNVDSILQTIVESVFINQTLSFNTRESVSHILDCLLYTSDAADE